MRQGSETKKWAVYGNGPIGSEIRRQVGQEHIAARLGLSPLPEYVVRTAGVFAPDGEEQIADRIEDVDIPDVSFLAIPSTDDGGVAYDYMTRIFSAHKLAVTAEKGALANFFKEVRGLSVNFTYLGMNAAVGGGTRMMDVAQVYSHDLHNISQLHMAPSGTLTRFMSLIGPNKGDGVSPKKAAKKVVREGLTEGSLNDPFEIIQDEKSDIEKKFVIFMKRLGLLEMDAPLNGFSFQLNKDNIRQLFDEPWHRVIISAYNKHLTADRPESDKIGGFESEDEDWLMDVSFRNIRHKTLFRKRLGRLTGALNGLVIAQGPNCEDGIIGLKGPGAGPGPTVNTMLDDGLALMRYAG